jgi:hypothetical protein
MAVTRAELDATARVFAKKLGRSDLVDAWMLAYDDKEALSKRIEAEWGVRGLISKMYTMWDGPVVNTTAAWLNLPLGLINVATRDEASCLDCDTCPLHLCGLVDYHVPAHLEQTVVDAARRLAATKQLHVKPRAVHLACLKLLVVLSLVYLDVHAAPRPRAAAATTSPLPCDVMFGIMVQLGDRDRRAAACVCRDWRDAAGDPLLATAESCLAAHLRHVTRAWGPIGTTLNGAVAAYALVRRWFGETADVG